MRFFIKHAVRSRAVTGGRLMIERKIELVLTMEGVDDQASHAIR